MRTLRIERTAQGTLQRTRLCRWRHKWIKLPYINRNSQKTEHHRFEGEIYAINYQRFTMPPQEILEGWYLNKLRLIRSSQSLYGYTISTYKSWSSNATLVWFWHNFWLVSNRWKTLKKKSCLQFILLFYCLTYRLFVKIELKIVNLIITAIEMVL